MLYRKFGKCNFEISTLGFGTMRLPVINGNYADIDEDKSIELIRTSIDSGINYIDTAYPYHGGNSELLVGKALKSGYREKVKLATKMPVWLVKQYSDFDKYLNKQLEKLQTDHIDMYLLHALSKERIADMEKLEVYKFLDSAIKDGRIKYAGFSFHDDVDTFKKIVDSYNWTFCQMQYNILDENYQAGTEGLTYAASNGLAVIIMEPLKGGKLAVSVPDEVKKLYSDVHRTPADISLTWVWNHPEVTLLLSGMNTHAQLNENIATSNNALPNSMSKEELKFVDTVQREYKKCIKVDCTRCEYCMPCPFGVDIPENFSLYNSIYMYNDLKDSQDKYMKMPEEKRASSCKTCGKCETLCPQHISIRQKLREAALQLQVKSDK